MQQTPLSLPGKGRFCGEKVPLLLPNGIPSVPRWHFLPETAAIWGQSTLRGAVPPGKIPSSGTKVSSSAHAWQFLPETATIRGQSTHPFPSRPQKTPYLWTNPNSTHRSSTNNTLFMDIILTNTVSSYSFTFSIF